MTRALPVSRLTIWSLSIPMRRKFSHATAERGCAEPIVVAIELSDGTVGYGETHPRPYVTGESLASVLGAIRNDFVPRLVEIHPSSFGEAIEAAADLPMLDSDGRIACAARAAVELALLDAYSRAFEKSLEQIAGWLEETAFGGPGSHGAVRYSGVISAADPDRVPGTVRKMRLFGLRDFKIKVGDDDDDRRVRGAVRTLGRSLARGRTTLRLDANAAWTVEQAAQRLEHWRNLPITCVEQPLAQCESEAIAELARRTAFPIMADESLVTPDQAEDLIVRRSVSWFNVRISKNGGLIPALQLAITARRHNIACQLGCMVGETSILSAAGRWFLQLVPGIRFAEGGYGRFLLKDDVATRPLGLSFGGRWKPMTGHGLGITVDPEKLHKLSITPPVEIPF